MIRSTSVLVVVLLASLSASAADTAWSVASPDGKLSATVTLAAPADTQPTQPGVPALTLSIQRENAPVLTSRLGLQMAGADGDFANSFTFVDHKSAAIDETYPALSGKRSTVINQANQAVLRFQNAQRRPMELVVRASNDAIAYRYRFPGEGSYQVTAEQSAFVLPAGAVAWAQPWRNNGETEYTRRSLGNLDKADLGNPMLLQLPDKSWALLTQAEVFGSYCALHFKGSSLGDGVISMAFPPDQKGPIQGTLPLETPWRVVITGGTLATLVESDVIKNLNPPSKLADTAWIKPGRVAWSWWSDSRSPRSFEAQTKFVDFAQEMGWEYVLVDEGWPVWEARVPELVKYAAQRNVGIILWRNAHGFDDATASKWAGWGVKGVKLDFIDSDRQDAYQKIYDTGYALTAKYNLLLNFHGCSKPAGESRTWPQNLTRESVKGAEAREVRSIANINYVFTRNVIGSMDYTPVQLSKAPTTFAAQVALSVLFESGLQHFVDTPEVYRASPAKEFLKVVPATWDDTKFIAGAPDEFVCLARRNGKDWYVGLNTAQPLTYKLPLNFLDKGARYDATLYKDGPTGKDIVVEALTVTAADEIAIPLLRDGGCAIRLTPAKQ